LEALLAPVELQAALLKGLKYKFFEVKNNEIPMTSRLKNPPTIYLYIRGFLRPLVKEAQD